MNTIEHKTVMAIGDEQRRIKCDAIKDIIDSYLMMSEWGVIHYQNIVYTPNWLNNTFDSLIDCDIETLHLEVERLSAECCRMFQYISDSNNLPNLKPF